MYFQVKVQVGMIASEKLQQGTGPRSVVIESAVQYAYVADAVLADEIQSPGNGFDGQDTYRFFSPADAEGTGVEASARGFQLHEGLAPVEETAFLGRHEPVETKDTCRPVIHIRVVLRMNVAQTWYMAPFCLLFPTSEPLVKDLLAFAAEHAIYVGMPAQIVFIVAQEFRSSQDHATMRKQCLDPGDDVQQGFVVEQPGCGGHDVGPVVI